MSDPEASPPAAPAAEGSPSPARKEELLPVGEKISELDQSQSELLGRLRGLKEDLQNWRNNLDTQVNKYRTELSDIKSTLNNEIEQLRTDFQELRTTLKKQQEDVTLSLQSLGLEDATENDGNKKSGGKSTNESANLELDDSSKKKEGNRDPKNDKTVKNPLRKMLPVPKLLREAEVRNKSSQGDTNRNGTGASSLVAFA